MKIVHTSDLHIDSALGARLTEDKAAQRRRELLFGFERLVERARSLGATVMIVAGDLFDTERPSRRAKDAVLSAIERARDIAFLYLPGNHERDALLGESLPTNLKVFGRGWTYFETDEIIFSGRSECAEGMFGELRTSGKKKNIAVLHGECALRSGADGKIGLSELEGVGLDHLALGHYHSYSKKEVGGCTVVYSGTPEGRGFDEVGEKGFSLIECEGGAIRESFVPFASRRLHDLRVDISGATGTGEVEERADAALRGIPCGDLVRMTLTGRCDARLTRNADGIAYRYSRIFYYFELHDESRTVISTEDFRYDKSLRGEFVRLVLGDSELSEEDKEKIIATGLSALDGDGMEEL